MTDELTFPVEVDEWVEFSTYEITVGHSAREERLTVTASGWAKIGDQVIYSAPRHSREDKYIRVKCGGRDWDVPLDKWRAFVDRVPVRVDGRSRSTIEMTPQLVKMARDVIGYRREAPTDDQWAKEIGVSMSDEAKTLVIQKTMKLNDLILDPEMQPRIELSQEVIDEYAEAMQRGDTFPPLEVYAVYNSSIKTTINYLTDGWHRYKAARRAELREFPVILHTAENRRDAVLAAAGANTKHGLRRSNEDKRKAIRTWLRDDEGATWSDNAIATQLHVSNKLVKAVRDELEALGEIQVVTERRTADGRVIDTSNIGQNQPEPKNSIKPGDRVVSVETGEVLGVVSSLVPMPGTKGKKALIKKDDGGSMWASEVDLRIAQAADEEPKSEPPVSPAKPAPKPATASKPTPKPEIPDWLKDYRKLVNETGSVVMFAVGEGKHVLVAFELSAKRVCNALRCGVVGTKVGPDLVTCVKVHDLHEPTMDRLYDEFGADLMIVTEDIDPKLKQFVDTRITTTAEYQPPMDEAAKQAAVRERMAGIFPGQNAQPTVPADSSSPPPWVTGEATTETSKPTFTVVGPFAMAMQRTTRFLGHALQAVADADEETTEEREHAIAHYMRGIVENNVQAVYDILSRVSEPENLQALGDLIENREEGRSADAVIRDWLWTKKQEADKPAEPEILELKIQHDVEEDDAA